MAKVRLAGKDLYLADNGRLIPENYGPEPEAAFVTELRAEDGLAPTRRPTRSVRDLGTSLLGRERRRAL